MKCVRSFWRFAINHASPLGRTALAYQGDDDIEDTYAGVGRVLSQWETAELELSRIYGLLLNRPDDIEAIRLYGDPKIFEERAKGLAAAAEQYFRWNPHQDTEAELSELMLLARQFSARRNEVAHSIVMPICYSACKIDPLSRGIGVMALTLAAIGAAVSLYGLVLMFGAAFLPIGVGLEAGKLTSAAALHRSWQTLGWRIRYALTGIVVVLMVLTSSGIYGFTLNRYLTHVAEITAPAIERAAAADEEIARQAGKVSDLTNQISDIDANHGVDVTSTARPRTAAAIAAQAQAQAAAAKLRLTDEQRRQTKRDGLAAKRDVETAELAKLRGERSRIDSQQKAAEAEVGPVKIVADVLGVDPGKVVATAVAAIYDALCVLLLLVAGHKPAAPAQAIVETAAVEWSRQPRSAPARPASPLARPSASRRCRRTGVPRTTTRTSTIS
jgi:hypothetical protein